MLLTAEPSLQLLVAFLFFLFLFFKDIVIYYMYTVAVFIHSRRRVSDLIMDSCKPPCGC